ncbi:hypothetical protein AGMMS50230_11320 [Spirochaetia bacterium]|nr:hypothetical protein AGMMS50230_11320 [Spirochaetia bacterium]
MNCVPEAANDPYHPYTFRELIMLHIKKTIDLPGISAIKIGSVKFNLNRLVMGSIGVSFINGEPDFAPFALATVKLDKYLDTRYGSSGTMPLADKILAGKLGTSEAVVRSWINDNQYVWHERLDGRHIDLLPHDVHGNIPHTGGISANKQR